MTYRPQPDLFSSRSTVSPIPDLFWPEWSSRVQFENKGVDVEIIASVDIGKPDSIHDHDIPPAIRCVGETEEFTVEIKPTVGDDYPTVLRQMLSGKVRYLFLERYTGVGVTEDQFIDMFTASGRVVVFKDMVDKQYEQLVTQQKLEDDWDSF